MSLVIKLKKKLFKKLFKFDHGNQNIKVFISSCIYAAIGEFI